MEMERHSSLRSHTPLLREQCHRRLLQPCVAAVLSDAAEQLWPVVVFARLEPDVSPEDVGRDFHAAQERTILRLESPISKSSTIVILRVHLCVENLNRFIDKVAVRHRSEPTVIGHPPCPSKRDWVRAVLVTTVVVRIGGWSGRGRSLREHDS